MYYRSTKYNTISIKNHMLSHLVITHKNLSWELDKPSKDELKMQLTFLCTLCSIVDKTNTTNKDRRLSTTRH